MNKIIIIVFVVISTILFIGYTKYVWHFPRDKKYEQKLIQFINNAIEKNDTNYYFRLDSVMNFKWDKVVFVGPYLSSTENLKNCNIDFEILENPALNSNDYSWGLLFLKYNNKPVKFLFF